MTKLTDLVRYDEAIAAFSREALWDLVDGDRARLNIAHECLRRHPPDRLAVRVVSAEGPDQGWSYGELCAWSDAVARDLLARGLAPGSRVAIMLDPGLAFYAALFGAMTVGLVAVPLFTAFGPDALRARLDDCAAPLLLTNADKAAIAPDGIEVVIADDSWLAGLDRDGPPPAPATAAADMAMYQYTSGTTRNLPEAVKHRHRAIVTVLIAALYGTGIRPNDRVCCPSSPAWGHGLWHGTIAPLALGATTTAWSGRFDPVRLMQALREHEINNLSAAATHLRLMKNAGAADRFRFALDKLSFTGEPIDSDSAAFCEATFGLRPRSMYGTTEVGVILGMYPGAPDIEVRPGALGKPMPGLELQVQAPDGRACRPDEIGEIMLKRGDAWIATKDRGRIDADGYFYHAGRADDVIISSGWTIGAVELEDALLSHPDIDEAAVIGVPDEDRGQAIQAYIVSRRPGDDAFAAEIREHARERLSRHAYPHRVRFVDDLPKTPAGKVNRRILRAEFAAEGAAA